VTAETRRGARVRSRSRSLAALLPLPAVPAFALDPAKAAGQSVHVRWDSEQGLPQNSIAAIVQISDMPGRRDLTDFVASTEPSADRGSPLPLELEVEGCGEGTL
jgi:hypothetical protein